ncbi:MAG TPA: hypothetical protein VGB28_02410 [Actinomycetota bacterium]|jgi:hypothetical protein
MAMLKRILYLQALVWAAAGVALVLLPGLLLHGLFDQPDYREYAWLRIVGIQGFVLALVMVMVAHRIDTLWWWSWAFALMAAAMASVFTLNAAFGLPDSAAAWPWWIFAGVDWLFALSLAWGLSRAGQEKPIV